jgi:hypothetical protein
VPIAEQFVPQAFVSISRVLERLPACSASIQSSSHKRSEQIDCRKSRTRMLLTAQAIVSQRASVPHREP